MDADRLKQIEELYHAATELPLGEREAFIRQSCGDDQDLRRELESLLAIKKSSYDFFQQPPLSLAAEMFSQRDRRSNLAGQQVSHYQIIRLLGAGGMGEVYLAEDTKLNRQVALKILTSEFETDVERIRRFRKSSSCIRAQSPQHHHDLLNRRNRR